MPGRRRHLGAGWAGLCPADLASVDWRVGLEPHPSAALGKKNPGCKKFCAQFLFPEKLLQVFEFCKMHRILHVCQKNVNDLSKCSEK
jgi:hypothetical protein